MSHQNSLALQFANCDARTQEALIKADWTPDRRIDVSNYKYQLSKAGYIFSTVFQEFLCSFGEIYIEWNIFDEMTKKNLHNDIIINPLGALARIGDEGLDDLDELLDTSLCPLGLLDHASEILLMDRQGRVYSCYGLLLYQCGETGVQAIDTLIAKKPILVLRDDLGNMKYEWS